MIRIILSLFVLTSAFILSSCNYDKYENLHPTVVIVDTSTVSYSKQVIPIMSKNCYSCHASSVAASSGGGAKLDTYTGLLKETQNGTKGVLISYINGKVDPMPKSGTPLSATDINTITNWVTQGAKNN